MSKEVIIVGAGASGLAAARLLADAGCHVQLLEARSSIGGRACTVSSLLNSSLDESETRANTSSATSNFKSMAWQHPIELGAEFIHGEGAATHQLVQQLGLSVVPVVRMGNLWWAESGQAAQPIDQLPPEPANSIRSLLEDEKLLAEYPLPQQDTSLADYLTSTRGRSPEDVARGDVLLAQTRCGRADDLSCNDIQHEMQVDRAGSAECRIAEGYSTLINKYSQGLEVHLDSPVISITWQPKGRQQSDRGAHGSGAQQTAGPSPAAAVSPREGSHNSQDSPAQAGHQQQHQVCSAVIVTTAAGKQYQADAVVVTASVAALQAGGIEFQPPLSAEKQEAVKGLRMEAATKLLFCFSRQLWPDELTFMCHSGTTARWWTPGYGRNQLQGPSGAAHGAIIVAYITAERAESVDALAEAEALQLGLQELCQLLQLRPEEARACLVCAKRMSWAKEPFIWGGYAHAPPGAGWKCRLDLAKPEGGVLFFAGEATAHDSNPQTVHGAMESGWRAAREVLAGLDMPFTAG